jgi:hypothetical protein
MTESLHFGWNLTEGGIFGAAVSGGQYSGLIVAPLSGPPFITGGAFGPEASIAAVAVSLGASGAGPRLAPVSWQTRQSALTSGCVLARRMLLCAH